LGVLLNSNLSFFVLPHEQTFPFVGYWGIIGLKEVNGMSEELLIEIMNEIKEMRKEMVTNSDLTHFATKNDLKNFATKEDLKNLATKEEVAEIPFIKAAVQDLAIKVDELTGRVSVIEKEMVRKVDLEYIHQKIAEHDREIFYLKNR
jgi:hypothetical protein